MHYNRLAAVPKQSFFLFGPRGTGKSTWLTTVLPRAHRVDLLNEARYQSLLAEPGRFADQLRAVRSEWVIVDEVQRLPALLNEVHRFIEGRRFKFALSGSSARKLRSSGVNLLAGRALTRRLHPFTPEELGADFDLKAALTFGTLPIVWSAEDRLETLSAYVQTYLREEIQAEALVRNLSGFARFLPIAALFHGQTLNVSSLARDAGVSRTTVMGYLEILEDTLVAFTLPGYEAKLRVRERKHPKLYWVDPGLVRAVKRDLSPPDRESLGPLFEGFVAAMLRAYADYRKLFDEWFYWAPAEARHTEVDFLLRRERDFLAIEVKGSARAGADQLKGLRAIADLPRLQRRVLVYMGRERMRTEDGIDVLPSKDFFEALAVGTLWTPSP